MNGETSKKVTSAEGDCFLRKDKIPSLKGKVKISGKSELEIAALIHRSLGIDLSVYVCSENLVICRLCYNMFHAYNKVLKRVNQIVDGIKQKFENNGPLRIKRSSKDSTKPPEPGGYSLVWAIWGRAAGQGMVFGLAVLNRVYNLTCLCPKQVKNLS